MFKMLLSTFLLVSSYFAPVKETPVKTDIQKLNYNGSLINSYNLKNEFDIPLLDDVVEETYILDIEPTGSNNKIVSWWYDSEIYYINKFVFTYSNDQTVELYLEYYDAYNYSHDVTLVIYNEFTIDDISPLWAQSIINFREYYLVHDNLAIIWSALFTHDDNNYVTSYTGYYNYTSGLSQILDNFAVFGSITFNTNFYFSMFRDSRLGTNMIYFDYFDVTTSKYDITHYSLPFNQNSVVSANVMMTGCKMSISSYQVLQNYGSFSFIRDTSNDDATFKDMLFGVMDSPLYFIHMLLGWELFGVNLYVAFTSLLTLMLILIFIRKFY